MCDNHGVMLAARLGFLTRCALQVACSLSALACSDNAASGDAKRLRNVDVTIIYPLPVPGDLDVLIQPTDEGTGGPLLPATVFVDGHIPELDELAPLADDAGRLGALRVVAIRFDPCSGAAPCRPGMRLVFQSLRNDGGFIVARDGAVHAFYELTTPAFQAAVDELRILRAEDAAAPAVKLDIHPRLRAEGPTGAFAQRIKALVMSHAGAANLVRVTHFRHHVQGPAMWSFAMRERRAGSWQDSIVPTTAVTEQSLNTISGGRWDADIVPAVAHVDDVTRLFEVATPQEESTAFHATVRVLNPRVHTSETIDCATCHIAPIVATFARSTRGLDVESYSDRFRSTYPLDAASQSEDEATGFQNVHMLSYLGTSLSVSARTANETALVLELLNE